MKIPDQKLFDVQTFGKFSITYDGREVVLGRNNTLKYVQLLQIVWLHGTKGVTKEQLINALYDREDLSNSNNSLNNLLYQMRQQMAKAGLPQENYIIRRRGVFFSNEEITVHVDVRIFETLIAQAEQTDDIREKLDCYGQAFELYNGELLPVISTEIWVMTESMRLKQLFSECVRWLGDYYKSQADYNNMYRIYTKAARIYPYDDWQVNQIDSLLARGDYQTAYLLYNETSQRYADEMGVPLSEEMVRCYERMSRRVEYFPGEMSEIKQGLIEQVSADFEEKGAYFCAYPGFVDVYRMLSRNMERTGKSIFLMICTLVDYEGKMIRNQEKLQKRSEHLYEAIKISLRRGDVYTRYNRSQYLILLIGTKQEGCRIVYRRISQNLKERAGARAELQYTVASLADFQVSEHVLS